MGRVTLTIDDKKIEVEQGTLIIEAAKQLGIDIPHFCYHPKLGYDANCRMCHVEIEKNPKLQASCSISVAEGMVVRTNTERVTESHRSVLEFILANHPLDCPICDQGGRCDLQDYSHKYTPTVSPFTDVKRVFLKEYFSPLIEKEMNRCVSCMRCVRYCDEIIDAKALAASGRGTHTEIKHFGGHQLDCEFCGGCVQICPVGAFTNRVSMFDYRPWMLKRTDTICGYCGDGCQLTFQTRDQQTKQNHIIEVNSFHGTGRNDGDLCARGYFGFEFINHPDRLTSPLVKRNGRLVEVTWEEALEYAAERLASIKSQHGAQAIAGLASSRLTNEDLYVFQKFMRAVIGTNHLDSSVRYGHINAATAMMQVQGTAKWTVTYEDIVNAKTLLLIGTNITETNPIVGYKVKAAVKKGHAKLITVESAVPVIATTSNITTLSSLHIQSAPNAYGAVIQGMVKAVLDENLVASEIGREDVETLRHATAKLSVDACAGVAGVSAELIRQAAAELARSSSAIAIVGQGVLRAPGGYESTLALLDLLKLTGHLLGRPAAGLAVLTEENNEQGALEMGVVPEYLPLLADPANEVARRELGALWGQEPPDARGLALPDMIDAAREGRIRAMYIVGENPVGTLPPSLKVKEALDGLDVLICQEIFLTDTAKCADVVFPAGSYAEKEGHFTNSEGVVQKVRPAIEPLGDSRPDWEILASLAAWMGRPMEYESVRDVEDEISRCRASLRKSVGRGSGVAERSRIRDGSDEELSRRYTLPSGSRGHGTLYGLTVGQSLFHSGKMSTFSKALNALQPEGMLIMHPLDGAVCGVQEGDMVNVTSDAGAAVVPVKFSERRPRGTLFFPEHFRERIGPVLSVTTDPLTRVPYCSFANVSVRKATS